MARAWTTAVAVSPATSIRQAPPFIAPISSRVGDVKPISVLAGVAIVASPSLAKAWPSATRTTRATVPCAVVAT